MSRQLYSKLNDLINNLFDLAQANIDITEFRELRLDELLWQVKDEWTSRIPGSKVDLQYNLPEDVKRYTIHGNNYLLFLVVGNVLKNAIKFSDNRVIICKLYLQGNQPVMSIRDTGIGMGRTIFRKYSSHFSGGPIPLAMQDMASASALPTRSFVCTMFAWSCIPNWGNGQSSFFSSQNEKHR